MQQSVKKWSKVKIPLRNTCYNIQATQQHAFMTSLENYSVKKSVIATFPLNGSAKLPCCSMCTEIFVKINFSFTSPIRKLVATHTDCWIIVANMQNLNSRFCFTYSQDFYISFFLSLRLYGAGGIFDRLKNLTRHFQTEPFNIFAPFTQNFERLDV